jgi:predicted metal-dependent phosphoesterase TrpH
MRIDFHLHTNRSDGVLAPRELLAAVRHEQLAAWAVTDHDSVAAWRELQHEPGLVAGIEITSGVEGREVHVVGLGIDADSVALNELLTGIRVLRRERIGVVISRLPTQVSRGVTVADLDDGRAESLGRNHLARAMLKRGGVASMHEAFTLHLGDEHIRDTGLPQFPPLRQCCEAIRAAGGVAILAHPGVYRSALVIAGLLDLGCDGLEVAHPNLDPLLADQLLELARSRKLLMSAGSDLHVLGARRPGIFGLTAQQLEPLASRLGLGTSTRN